MNFRQCLFLTNNLELNKYGKDLQDTTFEGGGYNVLQDNSAAWSVKSTERYSLSIKVTEYEGGWSCSMNRIVLKDGMNIPYISNSKVQLFMSFCSHL